MLLLCEFLMSRRRFSARLHIQMFMGYSSASAWASYIHRDFLHHLRSLFFLGFLLFLQLPKNVPFVLSDKLEHCFLVGIAARFCSIIILQGISTAKLQKFIDHVY